MREKYWELEKRLDEALIMDLEDLNDRSVQLTDPQAPAYVRRKQY